MRCHKPQQTYTTLTGLTLVTVPRPVMLGVILDANGQPSKVKYPNYWESSKTGYHPYSDLKGILKVDFDRIKPDLVIYQLGDGTLLLADLEIFEGSKMGTHNGSSTGAVCYIHDVDRLRVIKMPEIKEIPAFSFV
jgi:hypothetical protein